ncbi:MAG: S-methyl-5'-thioadenosine phosphorylase [Candidatus Omnitrophica bacterium]|nr:S-methyl-5'-thioadenosine phosphorylase [Candidatus Omnitrophota bacterium]
MEKIGIIGGSGLYKLDGINIKKEIALATPFGKPSDKFIIAEFEGREVVFLPRHDKRHSINPTEINYRANIYGMKKLGVGRVISVTACGSLKEEYKPLDFVIPTQFVDRTNQARKQTFFDKGVVAHISFAHPVCEDLAKIVYACAKRKGVAAHYGATYVNMEGPQFSTFAESNLYRSLGLGIIGMTNMTEARLAREAEICYSTLAAVTDYDCWHETHEAVTVDMIIANLQKNVENSKKIIKEIIKQIPSQRTCGCKDALKYAIVTNSKFIPKEIKTKLKVIAGKYIN